MIEDNPYLAGKIVNINLIEKESYNGK